MGEFLWPRLYFLYDSKLRLCGWFTLWIRVTKVELIGLKIKGIKNLHGKCALMNPILVLIWLTIDFGSNFLFPKIPFFQICLWWVLYLEDERWLCQVSYISNFSFIWVLKSTIYTLSHSLINQTWTQEYSF